jgi:hypothetical protein
MAGRSPGETGDEKKRTAGGEDPPEAEQQVPRPRRVERGLKCGREGLTGRSQDSGGVTNLVEVVAETAKRNELGHSGEPLSIRLATRGTLYVNCRRKSMKG